MKNSNIQWIGEIPDNWEVIKIGRLFSLRNERNFKPMNEVQLLSLYTGIGVFPHGEQEERGNKAVSVEGYKIVHKNDIVVNIILAWMGAIGVSNYDGVTSPAYDVYIPNLNLVVPHFYHYVFRTQGIADECYRYGRGIMKMRWRTYSQEFKQISVPYPSPAKQQQIAAYLDAKCSEIDGLIADINKQIETLNELKKSTITEAVTKGLNKNVKLKDSGIQWIWEIPEGWSKCRLKYLCEITTGNEDTQNADPDGEFPFYVRSPQVERCKRYTFDGEGILIAGDGAGAGRIFHHVFGKYAVHQRVYRLYNFKINTSYLHYYLSNIFPNEMDRGSAQSTVPSMRLPMLLNFNILIPSESEQRAIATYLDTKCTEFDSIISDKQKQISTLEAYKKSLIYEYVTGKNVPPAIDN